MDRLLNDLVEKLKQAAGANLKCVVLYGSAAGGEFQPKHSDQNTLCVLGKLDAGALEALSPVARWWEGKGHPAPLVFTLEELRRSADVFAIELLDIQARHEVLWGEDAIAAIPVPMHLHRQEVERELRTNLTRLRQKFLAAPRNRAQLMNLMTASVSTFTTLFRHALIALGEPPAANKREAVTRLAALLGFDATGFQAVLELREGKRAQSQVDVPRTFAAYLDGVTRVTEEVDRRLESPR